MTAGLQSDLHVQHARVVGVTPFKVTPFKMLPFLDESLGEVIEARKPTPAGKHLMTFW